MPEEFCVDFPVCAGTLPNFFIGRATEADHSPLQSNKLLPATPTLAGIDSSGVREIGNPITGVLRKAESHFSSTE